MSYDVELTDTFGGEANYCWRKHAKITMPELTHYGYDGAANYCAANKKFKRELMKRAKAAMGLTGVRGRTERWGDGYEFRPYGLLQVMFITWVDD